MRNRFLVSYDIANAKRLRKIFKKMNGFGEHVQYSVFCCDLSRKEKVIMIETLSEIIKHTEDRIFIADLGPTRGRALEAIEFLGMPTKLPQRKAIII